MSEPASAVASSHGTPREQSFIRTHLFSLDHKVIGIQYAVTGPLFLLRLARPDFEYEAGCSQLCGLGHYCMRGVLNVTTAGFQAYLAQEAQSLTR